MNPILGYTLLALTPTIIVICLCSLDGIWKYFWEIWRVIHLLLLMAFVLAWSIGFLIGE